MIPRIPWGSLALGVGGTIAFSTLMAKENSIAWRWPLTGILGLLVILRSPVWGWYLMGISWAPSILVVGMFAPLILAGYVEPLRLLLPIAVQYLAARRLSGALP